MNKVLIPLSIIGTLIIVIRLLGWIEFYVVSSPAMEPNLPNQEWMFGTNLKSPQFNDIIAYRSKELVDIISNNYAGSGIESGYNENSIFTSRIVGLEGDEIELKNGIIHINGRKSEPNEFLLPYSIENKKFRTLNKRILPNREFNFHPIKDSILIYLSKIELEKIQQFARVKRRIEFRDRDLFGEEGWSFENYGPIKVPEDHFFLISDNRLASMDSRVHGFVHQDDVKSVIFK